jgi:Uma2 family endonuclease
MAEYARFGVAFYWIVDPALGSVEIFALDPDQRYRNLAGMTNGVLDPAPGCSRLKLDLDALWSNWHVSRTHEPSG